MLLQHAQPAVVGAAGAVAGITAALGLVSVLLRLSGSPGLATIGLDRAQPSQDVRLAMMILIVSVVALTAGTGLLELMNLQGSTLAPSTRPVYHLVELSSAVEAGLVEEVCVLGFLVWCGRRAGWTAPVVLVLAVAVRVSFHLYYGWGALPIALWALVTAWWFLRLPDPRVALFAIAHACFDLTLSMPAGFVWPPIILLAAVSLVSVVRAHAAAPHRRPTWWLLAADSGTYPGGLRART